MLVIRAAAVLTLIIACVSAAEAQPPSEEDLYRYRAVVTDVYDGDTITVDLDLGFHVWVRGERIRLANIDAPELKGETKDAGIAARDFLRDLILDKNIIVQTVKGADGSDERGKYGRYLGVVWLGAKNINEALVTSGHAVYRDY